MGFAWLSQNTWTSWSSRTQWIHSQQVPNLTWPTVLTLSIKLTAVSCLYLNRVFFLDIPNDSILERITLRYLDPISGERFHMLFNPPPTQEIRDRLSQKSSDSEEAVKRRINDYYTHVTNLLEYYENNSVHINADQDPNTVFESIESTIVSPLPELQSEAPQKQQSSRKWTEKGH